MTREATDDLYIELDYYTPENYYTYTAEAVSSQSSSSEMAIIAVKTVSVDCVTSSEFTQTTFASRARDIDLFAFSDGALVSEAQRIRDNNIALATEFTVASDVARIRDNESDSESIFAISTQAERSRDYNSTIESAFSISVSGDKFLDTPIPMLTEAAQDITFTRLRFYDSAQSSESTVSTDAIITASANISLNPVFTYIDLPRLIPGPGGPQLIPTYLVNRQADAELTTESSLAIQPNAIFDHASQQSSASELAIDNERLRDNEATMTSVANVTAFGVKSVETVLVAFSDAAATLIPSVIRDYDSIQTAITELEIEFIRIRSMASDVEVFATIDTTISKLTGFEAAFTAFNTQLTLINRVRLDAIVYKIPGETRSHKIIGETRTYKIRSR